MKLRLISTFIRHKINALRKRWLSRVFVSFWLIGIFCIPFLFQEAGHDRIGLSVSILFSDALCGLFLYFIRVRGKVNVSNSFRTYPINDADPFGEGLSVILLQVEKRAKVIGRME
ncbi:hypothetical protein DMB45_08370 [Sanguibacteroides justesenii]|uniref:hypothetical protein n=1 Tax=Sanguibacteroides justesenii TaxID=1547597 RepID=UPI000D8AB3FF|nr:hypothetical protein [Sanguibacteroides justesenii]PXZ43975.1 hypothetical protein DMB45_08370 [Sanguibacteroides justesenii]